MTRKLCLLVVMIFALGTVGMSASPASAAGVQVPFSGFYSGTFAFTGPTTASLTGTGISTHLGSSTNAGSVVITGPDSSCPGGIANINTEILTAANGDTLTITSYDVGCPISPGAIHGTGHWVVTGGTGRFSGTTGQGTADGHGDFIQGVINFQLIGTISAPNGG